MPSRESNLEKQKIHPNMYAYFKTNCKYGLSWDTANLHWKKKQKKTAFKSIRLQTHRTESPLHLYPNCKSHKLISPASYKDFTLILKYIKRALNQGQIKILLLKPFLHRD